MASKRTSHRRPRRTRIELLEPRQMFSAEPIAGLPIGGIEHHAESLPDFWYDSDAERNLDALLGDVSQSLASAHQLTGATQALNDYGFVGFGQTVAVIDSGIAWDHPNLGGGFGAGYRVVGGWDFTEENDASPYDDGPSGSHGTHVAGIVGASANSSGDVGVASGVDLVGLRVFNDQGAGYFSWVERALQWVHTNRNAFDNPITAINLSLGTSWNAATVPSWAMLEEEFAQLKADGIFIAVSAGNSFTTYNAPGLSYPAASASVVPVMSVDDSGSLSYFSQRHTRAIAAPGRSIRSTVPDYVGNQNGVTDDWANYSGTSMASPYVAGASVLVREAMEFVGYTNITQDTIYNHMLATADDFFDTATNQTYKRLDVLSAIDALIPDDDYGSTVGTAFNLGTIDSTGASVSGLIGKRNDVDYFRFTAAATGTVTFTADTTNYLDAVWTGGGVVSGPDGNTSTLDVVAGQSYTIGISSSDGIGYFDLAVSAESVFTYTEWGTVAQTQVNNVATSGEAWYRVTASQAGYLTAEAMFNSGGGSVALAWFDANLQQVANGQATPTGTRSDLLAAAGGEFYLRVSGTNADVDFRLTNLVAQTGSRLSITGTAQADVIVCTGGPTASVTVNGTSYGYDAANITEIFVDGNSGNDTLTSKSGHAAAIRTTEVESLTDHDATALALNQDLGLAFSKSYYVNWSGFQEKWLLGSNGWYFVTPDGSLYLANSSSSLATTPRIAQLDACYYDNPSLLHDASATLSTADQQLVHQIANLGLHVQGSEYRNWGGLNEKWVLSNAREWYFITPDGTLCKWAGGAGVAGSTVVATVDSGCYASPNMLGDASMLGSFSAQIAYQLDTTLGLSLVGSYSTNWAGKGEKWIRGTGSNWYYITPSGGFYQWSGNKSLVGSRMLAALDVSYYVTPSRLHEAVLPMASAANVQAAAFAELNRGAASDSADDVNSRHASDQLAATNTGRPQVRVVAGSRGQTQRNGDATSLLTATRRKLASAGNHFDDGARESAFGDSAPFVTDAGEWLVSTQQDGALDSLHAAFASLGVGR